MASYPPRSQPFKKQEILDKRIAELRHALLNDFAIDKIDKIVSRIREAQIKLYKGKVEQFRFDRSATENYSPGSKAKRELDRWQALTNDEIIKLYNDNA